MNAEQRRDAKNAAESLDKRVANGWHHIAALLRAGIAASEQAELLELRGRVLARIISRLTSERQDAWLAAWDAEWHRQFETADLAGLANDYVDACVANARLRALLERAAGHVSRVPLAHWACGTQESPCMACAWEEQWRRHLLAEIEGALK